MTILFLSLVLLLLYLIYERIALNRLRESIPLIVSVTGTRGKSTVVCMLASVLRESGRRVLAKTTGSQARFVLPDGIVQDVPRRGIVSILEQKKVLEKAVRSKADCLVVEVMSIHPENHLVESRHILKPNIVLLTNIRRDHIEAMGESEQDIARVLCLDVPPTATVYVPEGCRQYVESSIMNLQPSGMRTVQPGSFDSLMGYTLLQAKGEFAENLDLVAAVAKDLGIEPLTVARGIQNTLHDVGRLKVWSYRVGGKRVFLVNAFAANDPDSTIKVLDKVRESLPGTGPPITGLLNLRADRADRTLQWIEALNAGLAGRFKRIYVVGGHAYALRRKVKHTEVITHSRPDGMTNAIIASMENDGVLFGFGNIGGAGRRLVELWQTVGEEYGI
jgi:poly-gamma-glutamate synthase PgsB/CapB